MDPLSIIVATVALGEVCLRVGSHLRDLYKAVGQIDDELEVLIREVEGISKLCNTIQETLTPRTESDGSGELSPASPFTTGSDKPAKPAKGLWDQLGKALEGCRSTVSKLDDIVMKIQGNPTSSLSGSRARLDAISKALRKKLRETELRGCRAQLATFRDVLHLVITTLIYQDMGNSRNQNARSLRDLSKDIQKLDENLRSQIYDRRRSVGSEDGSNNDEVTLRTLEDLRDLVASTAQEITRAPSNQHFDIPQSVSTIFTGRDTLFEELEELFIPKQGMGWDEFQRRFIIHGLSGSGKTQFCCKFAQDNRESFWGVFWIDASTEERAKQTLCVIAEIAGREKNENAALNWLSNLEHRWLLIIDNVDDDNIPLERYFPKGNRGNILVTTRNPAYKMYGNVGHYHFRGLSLLEATNLLLTASDKPRPWDSAVEALAFTITEALGYLALAIIHAGAAIRDNLCSLNDYLSYYDRRRKQIWSAKLEEGTTTEAAVFTTWEICYDRLEGKKSKSATDALELLNILAFLHRENISPEIFTRALGNPGLEAAKESNGYGTGEPQRANSWADSLRGLPLTIVAYILQNRTPAVLPGVMRDAATGLIDVVDAEDRIRLALKELTHMSLIIRNDHNNTYSMHPLVHTWARERPRERLPDGTRRQARLVDDMLFVEMTGRILAASILLPPLGTSQDDEAHHISLLPHLEHVQMRRAAAAAAMESKRMKQYSRSPSTFSSWITNFLPPPPPDPAILRMNAKFALVYANCGRFNIAESLLSPVVSTLAASVGPQDPKTIAASIFLSSIYFMLGRSADAASLLQSVLEISKAHHGPSHPDTLRVMSELGKTRWQQGMYSASRELQVEVLRELTVTRKLEERNPEVLDAKNSLGLSVQKFWEERDFEEAFKLHSEAAEGMAEEHGPQHEKTLSAIEHLCRVAVLLGGEERVAMAVERIEEVLEVRRQKLGRDHGHTLHTTANTAIVLSAAGRTAEAESLIREGLPVADISFGVDHIGTLFGRHTLACVIAQRGRYKEAEDLLRMVTNAQKKMGSHRGDYHPDRLGALIELARCCFMQGKLNEAVEICEEALTGFDIISKKGRPHRLAIQLRQTQRRIAELKELGEVTSPGHQHGVTFPFILFKVDE